MSRTLVQVTLPRLRLGCDVQPRTLVNEICSNMEARAICTWWAQSQPEVVLQQLSCPSVFACPLSVCLSVSLSVCLSLSLSLCSILLMVVKIPNLCCELSFCALRVSIILPLCLSAIVPSMLRSSCACRVSSVWTWWAQASSCPSTPPGCFRAMKPRSRSGD